ncbi:MAG: hypothetical protein V7607_5652 [Solirubrobacteraceae bacterium]
MNIGIVGCGTIAKHYAANAAAFDAFRLVACADVFHESAEALGAEHGLEVATVEELTADPSIDVVLNLTPPVAHAAVIRQALDAGKHVYSEKPLAALAAEAAELVAEAERRGLRIGCAPDIVLGGAYQVARALIDEGAIGEPLAVNAAALAGGQTKWHPNPDIFYTDGAGPLLDFGPYHITAIVALLGPIRRVSGLASTRMLERRIAIGPRAGESFAATTPTHVVATMALDDDVTASLITSFEADAHYLADFQVYGSEGALSLPDPNAFEGPVRISTHNGDWRDVAYSARGPREARGLGLQDMVEAIGEGRPHRASGRLAHHVVDVAREILASAAQGTVLPVQSTAERPAAMPVEATQDA